MRPLLPLLLLLPFGAAVACTAANSSSSDDSDLIGGRNAQVDEFAATLMIKDNCTVSKVGPRHILTAAHCVTGWSAPKFVAGATLQISSAKGIGAFTDAAPDGGAWRNVTVEKTEVHPAWRDKCAAMECGGVHIAGRNEMPDLAIIVTREDLTDIAEAGIDLAPVVPGDRLAVTGYGCEDAVGGFWNYENRRLRVAETEAIAFGRTIHPGSFVYPEDRDNGLASKMDGVYVITPGPTVDAAIADAAPSDGGTAPDASTTSEKPALGGLCPGDSGGPLYRIGKDETPVIVGVNANYTFSTGASHSLADGTSRTFQYGGSPVTNWHTRLDTQSGLKTGTWLRELGVRTVCSRGTCE